MDKKLQQERRRGFAAARQAHKSSKVQGRPYVKPRSRRSFGGEDLDRVIKVLSCYNDHISYCYFF